MAGRIITDNIQREMRLAVPAHHQRQAQQAAEMRQLADTGSLSRDVGSIRRASSLPTNKFSGRASDSRVKQADVQQVMPRLREPLETWQQRGIPFQIAEPEERKKIRQWARMFYQTSPIQSLCVDVYARFPVQGVRLSSKDPELTKFYEDLFFDSLDYETFLVDYGREFWLTGEVNSLASFNEILGVWEEEEILNPDDVMVSKSPFTGGEAYRIAVPEYLKKIITERSPVWEFNLLEKHYPDIVKSVLAPEGTDDGEESGLEVSSDLISRSVNKTSPWDLYGTPHMLRAFSQLMMEETLNAAQNAVADRLYSPFILAKLGASANDMGDGQPWFPNDEEVAAFTNDMEAALNADFKLLVHHFGLDIKSVFGRESMPRLDNDFDRLEKKQLQVWGIGESMISGSNSGTYASSAVNREFFSQLLSTYQKQVVKHFRKRAEIVAEAQEHFDYNSSGGVRTPIYEEVLRVDEETGEQYVAKRPKLLIPDIEFSTVNLSDQATERQFMKTLKDAGVPISDERLSVFVDIDFAEEAEKVQQEKIDKVVAEIEYKIRLAKALKAKGLEAFAPEDVKEFLDVEVTEPDPDLELESDSSADSKADGNIGTSDITDGVDAPNIAPVLDENGDQGEAPLPRSQIRQRPEISDDQRKTMPKASAVRFKEGPGVVGFRDHLSESSVEDAVANRRWAKTRNRRRSEMH